jgi:hypothetical protein
MWELQNSIQYSTTCLRAKFTRALGVSSCNLRHFDGVLKGKTQLCEPHQQHGGTPFWVIIPWVSMTSFIIYDGMIRTRLSQSAQICCCSFLMFSVRDECHAVICFGFLGFSVVPGLLRDKCGAEWIIIMIVMFVVDMLCYLFWTCESCRPSARTGCRTRASCWAKWCVRDSTGRRRTWRPVQRCRPSDPLGRSHLSEIPITYFLGGLVWFGLENFFGRWTRVWEKKWKRKTQNNH